VLSKSPEPHHRSSPEPPDFVWTQRHTCTLGNQYLPLCNCVRGTGIQVLHLTNPSNITSHQLVLPSQALPTYRIRLPGYGLAISSLHPSLLSHKPLPNL
jgi:hypothetical protein